MRTRNYLAALACTGMVASAGVAARAANTPDLAARGSYLARVGDCVACHTSVGGQPFAGGNAIHSPFGAIFAPNITPDKATGVGDWSEDDFYRAMHEGVGKHGEYLYPAFPYQWFTKIKRDDIRALKAYLDTVAPVNAKSRQTRLMFPFDLRAGIAGWNAAFFKPGEFRPDPAKSNDFNRGAYLVEGLGHCGDCHTPKGAAMEPIESKAFSGGAVDKWYAPNVTSDAMHGIGGWSDKELVEYLKTGAAPDKGVVVGPMSQILRDCLAHLTDDDLHAIVVLLKSTAPINDYKETPSARPGGPHATGEAAYLSHCAYCHQTTGKGLPDEAPALDGNDVVRAKGPEDVIRVVLGGRLATGPFEPMPAVGAEMSDQDIADVVTYVRDALSNRAPATPQNGIVAAIRAQTHTMLSAPIASQKNARQTGAGDPAVNPIDDPQRQIDQSLEAMNDETMSTTVDELIARVREVAPDAAQADIVDNLTLAYCRTEPRREGVSDVDKHRLLTRFSQLVYTELASNSKD